MIKETLSFDDVLLVPGYSDIESRSQINIGNNLDDNIHLSLPVISSPMDTVTEEHMCLTMAQAGGMGIIHRYNTIEEQVKIAERVFMYNLDATVGAAIGMTGDYMERAQELCDAGVEVLCIDVAHGHHAMMKKCLTSWRFLKISLSSSILQRLFDAFRLFYIYEKFNAFILYQFALFDGNPFAFIANILVSYYLSSY